MKRDRRSDPPSPQATIRRRVGRYERGRIEIDEDLVTVEEPLEIRVVVEVDGRQSRRSVAVTMRTPGEDLELTAGFLVSEGVVRNRQDIWRIEHCREAGDRADDNVVEVHLAPTVEVDFDQLSRNVLTSSACGICGRTSIESVQQICLEPPRGDFQVSASLMPEFAATLEGAQGVFAHTGGIHAAALFSPTGELFAVREDVGRHNALDKLVGSLLMEGRLPAAQTLVMVSGRASFELVQKSLLAGIPVLAAVGAPSSLAIDLAREYDMTLIGFLRHDRFNIYCGDRRVTDT